MRTTKSSPPHEVTDKRVYSATKLTRTHLHEFLKDEYKANDIPLADINKRMLDKLYLWLITEKKFANNTATKFIHRCSWKIQRALTPSARILKGAILK